jgi:hypothetical protein
MNRSRTFAAVVLSAVLLVTAAPALQARPMSQSRVSVPATGGEWLSAAWSWLAQTLGIHQPVAPTARHEKASSTTTSDGGLGGAQTMSGSCIDPNGCTTTGGGGGGGRP